MDGFYILGGIALVSLIGMTCIVIDMIYPQQEEVVIPKQTIKPYSIEEYESDYRFDDSDTKLVIDDL